MKVQSRKPLLLKPRTGVGEKSSHFLHIAKLRRETRYFFAHEKRSNIDVTGRIGKDRRDYIRNDGKNEIPFIHFYSRSGTSLSNESRVGKTSFTWQSYGSSKFTSFFAMENVSG